MTSPPVDCGQGHLYGTQLQPRDLAALAYAAGFTDARDLVVAVAVCLAESQGYDRAVHDNCDDQGKPLSRDVGLWQINIAASYIGTPTEDGLYEPDKNAEAAASKFAVRGFEPWVAFTTGVYLHDSYLKRACRGVGNFLGEWLLDQPVPDWNGQPVTHDLSSPLLDYEYRVEAMIHLFRAIETIAKDGLHHTTAPVLVSDLRSILDDAVAGYNAPKK